MNGVFENRTSTKTNTRLENHQAKPRPFLLVGQVQNLTRVHRDLIKHSVVYGIGQVLPRIASILLLPIYTRHLTPQDYGCVAILDLVTGFFAIFIGSGLAAAVSRFHFEFREKGERDRVWWTGYAFIVMNATMIVAPAWLFRHSLARLSLGADVLDGAHYYAIVLPTLWFNIIQQIPDAYLRVKKRSGLIVLCGLGRLVVNVSLNVSFLIWLDMGVFGVLVGNLITAAAWFLVMSSFLVTSRGRFAFDRSVLSRLFRFSRPLIVTALLAFTMHEADRYLLRVYTGMEQVGLYSLAYRVGHGLISLCLLPFTAIWGVAIYEIAEHPNKEKIFAQVFEVFVYGISLLVLASSLYAPTIVELIADPSYREAAELIPIICLGYLFFCLNCQFRVPSLLAKRTALAVPGYVAGTVVNIVGNLLLLPYFGMYACAWMTVLGFFSLALVDYFAYRLIEKYDYPIFRSGSAVLAMGASYLVFRAVDMSPVARNVVAAVLLVTWGVVLALLSVRSLAATLPRKLDYVESTR